MKRAFLAAVAALCLTTPARAELDDNGKWLSSVLGAITYAEAHCHDMKINHLAMQQLMAGRGYGPKHKPEQDMVDIVVAAHRFKLGLEESPPAAVCSNLWGHFGGAGSDQANILLPK